MSHYVAFEGIEGAGKSTVVEQVAARLRLDGGEIVTVREPGGTEVGEGVRHVLLDPDGTLRPWTEALLFAAQRSQLAAQVIRPALEAGKWVLGDRSVYSSLAYQGGGRGLGVDKVRVVNEAGLGGTWPDLVVLLRLSPGLGLARQAVPDRIGSEGDGFQQVVADTFDRLAASEPHRFVVIDAGDPLEKVCEASYRAIVEAAGV